ncbi:plant UBX domain-containing protein 2 [Rhodamnia argentea]|uniref:Plant UBX domain-containing protein 2 n=1 Tax=Rhodamnia argentea TaxID=178133 RepID=A0A8B8P2Z9_9MYRT|nr:plant UBX domain-containing protein 2 [Rhodamnia argentea]XP_048135072.1 plant UBX domain-containing protein 2 [Rhodamnia argentea]
MDDMKDKVKGFMKKVNNPFSPSSSTGKFKGQGRVLGSSTSGPTNPIPARPSQSIHSSPNPSPAQTGHPRPSQPPKTTVSDQNKLGFTRSTEPDRKPAGGFDPFDSLITSGKRSQNGYSLNTVECPVCNRSFRSEDEVSEHVDSCVAENQVEHDNGVGAQGLPSDDAEERSELEACVGTFVSAKPPESSVDVLLKLFRNIAREPENAKFRRIRLSNPKIKEAIGDVAGGVELLEFVGFELKEEGGEMWALMDQPGEEQIRMINKAVVLLEPKKFEEKKKIDDAPAVVPSVVDKPMEKEKIDRQIRVFFSVPESIAARIELPDSFYKLSMDEVRREAEMRKKKMAESQLLIPKSYREKQLKAGRKRYTRTVIRIQFPDGVVLQGVFAPWELTGSLYEFVSSALKDPCLEFELMHPVVVKRRVIPHLPEAGQRATTLDDEDLVPSALIKFRPIETDSVVFTGLRNELLEISEPLQ